MTTKTEALKLALKNLLVATKHLDVCPGTVQAAEEALAQEPVMDYDKEELRGTVWDTNKQSLAQPEPTPEQEREACAELVGEYARKWWSIHCASNKHMETTRKAHDDFCALQAMIRARGETSPPAREWVGLTDKQYIEIVDENFHAGLGLVKFSKAIEAKLKELNYEVD